MAQAIFLDKPNNLPLQLTSFIGRERERVEIKRLLSESRLLTLIGPAGTGKTRLALQVAADALTTFTDGVWLVELASLSDPALIAQAVAIVLGVRDEPDRPLLTTLAKHVYGRSLLLLLDNCEHLIQVCAILAEALRYACPNLRILATSRERLGIAGETTWLVPPLSLPDLRHSPSIETLMQCEAVRLFIDRARAVQPAFAVTNRNAQTVAQVCHRLDGLPLAIELAAARVRVLSVSQIAARLDNRFLLLTGGSRLAPPRQQTLRMAIDWSYDLLSEVEQILMRRLSVFVGGWTLEAAEAVCAGERIEAYEVLDLLTHLVDKSLVVVEQQGEEARYRFLETIWQYAREKLLESGESEALRRRHWDWFLRLAQEAESKLDTLEQTIWLNRLESEHDNMRAVLRRSLESREMEVGLRLAGALVELWEVRGYLSEGREWLGRLLIEGSGASANVRAKALHAAGFLARVQGDYERAMALYEESLAISRELGDKYVIAFSLNSLGEVARYQGDSERAAVLFEESLALHRELGGSGSIAWSLNNLGEVARCRGDYVQAVALLKEGLSLYREIGDKWGIAWSLRNLGGVARCQGDYTRALALLKESLALYRDSGSEQDIVECLDGLASLAGAQGQAERAAWLFGAAEAFREVLSAPLPPADRVEHDSQVAAVHSQLDDAAFAAAWTEGRTMTLQQAMAYAENVAQIEARPELHIQLDEAQIARQVGEIIESDYFQSLLEKADALRFDADRAGEWNAKTKTEQRPARVSEPGLRPSHLLELIGKQLGAYRIGEPVGIGGMATVYKAFQPSMNRVIAIKVLPAQLAINPAFLARFRQEAQIIARLEHAHILPVYDYGESEGLVYIVMRYLDGGSLQQRIDAGRLPLRDVNKVITQIASALDYAHRQGVIHRDIKPSNVLFDRQGDAFLADFGIAKLMEATLDLTGAGVIGTPEYMSPEQGQGLKVDARIDVYSLGVVLYETLTGRLPFEADTLLGLIVQHATAPLPPVRVFAPDLPESIESVLDTALAKQPADRFATAGALAAALDQAIRTGLRAETKPLDISPAATQPSDSVRRTGRFAPRLPARFVRPFVRSRRRKAK